MREVQVDNQREDASHPVLLKRRGEGKAHLAFWAVGTVGKACLSKEMKEERKRSEGLKKKRTETNRQEQ